MSDNSPKNDRELDELLRSSLDDMPPEDIVSDVTPWKKAMDRILVGMALCTLTLNFLCLNYILPAIGTMLLILGFRSIRRENRWLNVIFIITVIRAVYYYSSLIICSTVYSTEFSEQFGSIAACINVALILIMLFCFWRSLCLIRARSGLKPKAGGAAALLIWYIVMLLLALVKYEGLIIGLGMIITYIFIIRSLSRISKELGEVGYSIDPAPVRIPDRAIVISVCTIVGVGLLCGYAFFSEYDMSWQEISAGEHDGQELIEQQLISLGFPEDVLADLSTEDLAACEGAVEVAVSCREFEVGESDTLYITGAAVHLADQRETWLVFHHFRWSDGAAVNGTESVQLWPTYRDIAEGWTNGGYLGGRVLHDKNGTRFSATYHYLGTEIYSTDTMFWGIWQSEDVFAAFSMPRDGENRRGYVVYSTKELTDGYIISSWMNYTHQDSLLQYPVKTAMQERMSGSRSPYSAFSTLQDALQFYPTADGIEMIE